MKINATRHHLNGVHTGYDLPLFHFQGFLTWIEACEWAHNVSCDPNLPEIVTELENCENGDKLDLSRYTQRTKTELPLEKILLELPEDMCKLEPLTPRRRKDDNK